MKKVRIGRKIIALMMAFTLLSFLPACGREERDRDEDETEKTSESSKETTEAIATTTAKPVVEFEPGQYWPVPVGTTAGDGMLIGYMDATGKWLIEPKYTAAAAFDANGLAMVSVDYDQNGLIDLLGNELLPLVYNDIQLSENIIVAHKYDGDGNSTSFAYDLSGKELFSISGSMENFSEGLAFLYAESGNGFVNKKGEMVIELGEAYATSFSGGMAKVTPSYELPGYWIDKKGNETAAIVSEGITTYSAVNGDTTLYGYQDAQGKQLTAADYVTAEPFRNGVAIVGVGSDTYSMRMGLINTKGEFIIPAVYCGIKELSNGLYAVGTEIAEDAFPPYGYIEYSSLALFNAKGEQLSDWVFGSVENYDNKVVQVSNDRLTYFVDQNGQESKDMPSFIGIGKMELQNDYWVGTLNDRETITDRDGRVLVEVSPKIIMQEGFEMTTLVARMNRFDHLQYPVISGMKNQQVQDKINQRILQSMGNIYAEPEYSEGGIIYYTITDGGYRAWTKGNLLIIEQDSYSYPLGAVHGMPFRTDLYFDMSTGEDFTLDDLLLEADREEAYSMLSLEVSRQMVENMEEQGYWDDHAQVPYDAPFRLMNDGFTIYFMPYELASFANGFTEFPITFELMDVYINKEGAFWKALTGS